MNVGSAIDLTSVIMETYAASSTTTNKVGDKLIIE